MLRPVDGERWEALVRPGRRCRAGARVSSAAGAARVRIVAEKEDGVREVRIEAPWPVRELLERHGVPPLPPYIARHDAPKPEDRERYQTVYARHDGSVAAPTAGLHFTADLLGRLGDGAEVHFLTLHVGAGTFRPLRAARVEEHRIAAERSRSPEETAAAVNERGPRAAASSPSGPPRRGRSSGRRRQTGGCGPSAGPPISSSIPATASGWSTRSSRTFTSRARPCCCSLRAFAGRDSCCAPTRHAVAARLPLLLVRRRDADR